MKKTLIIAIAKIAASVSTVALAATSAQASVYNKIVDVTGTNTKDHLVAGRRELDNTNHLISELIGSIDLEHGGDPMSMDSFDVDAVGAQLLKAGLIADLDTWRTAAEMIEADGFVAYLEEFKAHVSTFERVLDITDQKLDTWTKLDTDARMTAISDNTDDNIVPVLAKLKVAATMFDSFAQTGMLMFAELSYRDKGAGSMFDDTIGAKQTETVAA